MATGQEIPKQDLYVVAGGMPPGLNTTMPADMLSANETPDCYGMDLTKDGRLASGTVPTGTSRIQKAITISSVPYYWHFNRLWNITNSTAATASNILVYGAKFYNDIYVPQRNGKMYFDEDSANIVAIVPIQPDTMFVAKTTGSYTITNINGQWASFQKGDIMQELACPAITNIIQVNNVVYISNTTGLWAYKQGQAIEISRKIRNTLYGLTSMTLTANYEKGWIIGTSGTTSMVYDTQAEKLHKWAGSTFRYTSRQFHAPDYAPIGVSRLLFTIEHGNTQPGSMKYQVRYEDESWPIDSISKDLPATEEKFTVVSEDLDSSRSAIRFQIRITALTSNKYIKEIKVDSDAFRADAYRT